MAIPGGREGRASVEEKESFVLIEVTSLPRHR